VEIAQQVFVSATWCMSYSNSKYKNTSAHYKAKHEKVICSGTKMKIFEKDLADKVSR